MKTKHLLIAVAATLISVTATAAFDFTRRSDSNAGSLKEITTKKAPRISAATPPEKAQTTSQASLYGCVIGADSWGYYNKPVGVHKIDISGSTSELVTAIPALDDGNPAATAANGKIHACIVKDFFGNISSLKFTATDVATGETEIYYVAEPTYDQVAINMTYDAVNDVIYTINYTDDSLYEYNLCTYSPSEHKYTVLTPLQQHYYAFCCDPQGQFYGICDNGEVVGFSAKTGEETAPLAVTNFMPEMLQSACWSPVDAKIYWAACNYSDSRLIAIDPATGTCETLCIFDDGQEIVGLYTTDPVCAPQAPAAPQLKIAYNSPSQASIDMVLPSQTASKAPLTGSLTLKAKVDGQEVASYENKLPGETIKLSLELTEGRHSFEAQCENAAGAGLRTTATLYGGADIPSAVADLNGSVSGDDNTEVTLSWSAPGAGVNQGYFDPENITYNVLCDGRKIADGLKATTFSYTAPAGLAARSYAVETVYNTAITATSAPISLITGRSLALPYENTFSAPESMALLTVIDNNNDNKSWFWSEYYQAADYKFSETSAADDYLVLPPFEGRQGHIYRLEYTARSLSASYPERLEIVTGTAPEAQALTNVVKTASNLPSNAVKYTVDYQCLNDGSTYFALHCVSLADKSELIVDRVKISHIGHAEGPQAPSELSVVSDEDGNVTINLTAPSRTLSNASLAAIDRVVLERDGVEIDSKTATPGQALQFSDKPDFGFHTYAVYALSDNKEGARAEQRVFAGTYTLPFAVEPDADEFQLFTIEPNEANDDNEWYFDISENALKISTYGSSATDQYIFSPAISFDTRHMVDLSIDIAAGPVRDTEKLEITFGTSPTRANATAVGQVEVNNPEFTTYKFSFPVETSGRYYIGFRALSAARSTCLSVKNIRLEAGSPMNAPTAVTDVEITPAPLGALQSTITFTAPTLTLEGNELTSTVDVTVTRADGSAVGTLTNLNPGQKASITDQNASEGQNTYTFLSSNLYGEGVPSQAGAWIGVDIPGAISTIEGKESADNLRGILKWSAPTEGIHGGHFLTHDLEYVVYQLINGRDLLKLLTTKSPEAEVAPVGDFQDFHTFYVAAVNSAGEGQPIACSLILGEPLPLPFEETASGKIITAQPIVTGTIAGDVFWGVADYIGSLDLAPADGGMFVCSAKLPNRQPGMADLQIPKLCFNGLNAPTLSFSLYHYPVSGAGLDVVVKTESTDWTEVFSTQINAEAEGWKTYTVNLAAYKDCQWVAIDFGGWLDNGAAYVIMDDIRVENLSDHDLQLAAVRGPKYITVGQEANYEVVVKNQGLKPATPSVRFTVNNESIGEITSAEPLQYGQTKSFNFSQKITADHLIAAPLVMYVIVDSPEGNDEIMENNELEFEVQVNQPQLPVITDLIGEQTSEGAVAMSWTAPDIAPKPVTDSFEAYESFIYEGIGDYVTIDGDGLTPCGIQDVTFPNMGHPMAFQVWEPMAEGVDVTADFWAPHTGSKCLVAWTALSSIYEPFNDDWLISPMLDDSEEGRKISLWASRPVGTFGNENFEVLYSSGSTDSDDFTRLDQVTVSTGGWKEYAYTLPEGARRFAVRYVSRDKFALLFDDFTFIPSAGENQLAITGFKVLRNGVETAKTIENSHVDLTPEAESAYHVIVNYNGLDSEPSNTARLSLGSSAIAADGIKVSSKGTELIINAPDAVYFEIFTAEGKTIGTGKGSASFSLPAGHYFIKTAGQTIKIKL